MCNSVLFLIMPEARKLCLKNSFVNCYFQLNCCNQRKNEADFGLHTESIFYIFPRTVVCISFHLGSFLHAPVPSIPSSQGKEKAGHPCILLPRWMLHFCQALITANSKLQHEQKSGESQALHHSLCLLWWTLVINLQMCFLGMLRFHPWLIPCFMMT